jgi:hypothetical protein
LAVETRLIARVAIVNAVVGVFLTWTNDGPVHLNGLQGPNNGWLVLIVSVIALAWTRPMFRGSWIGVVGMLGSAAVIGWVAVENWLDNRDVFGATAGIGLILVFAASVALACAAVVRGAALATSSHADDASTS